MAVEGFVSHLKNMSRPIADTYYYLLRNFEKWLQDRGKTIETFTPNDVSEFVYGYDGLAPRSRNLFLSAIRQYARWRASETIDRDEFIRWQRLYTALMGIKPTKVGRKIEKVSLTLEELDRLLMALRWNPKMFYATIVHFYFGWRPVEAVQSFTRASINWDERFMILRSAKTGNERILPWASWVDRAVREWYRIAKEVVAKHTRPRSWYTSNIKYVASRLGLRVTAKTARKTFETQMRARGIEQWVIDSILGHTTKIPDVYTDWSEIKARLANVMENKHYMLEIKESLEL